ncbi:zinc ribbon domain-containing protein [Hymenobacter sp. ASUV-10]|uniref:Zinc ribbon domain-containing protein n=1 Tax=Hymenobacter aranciens TaxID=3063996 RepID=A0ABT9BH60_9BACT|nr:zinc ribbon domain-containing protein [Hymenobacter sp. ASUV-10]MDO7876342.1 zinc ribbon domain-containing protein [Hymenobacter sp. ASUV-10]
MIQFVANYDDLSTDKGFQFKFHCDRCRNGYMSRFQPNAIGIAGSLLNAAGSFFSGLSGAESAAYHIQRAVGGKAHDSALESAVVEGKQHFKQCTRCGHWVCPDVCWNANAGLCEDCAPDEQEELRAQQSLAAREQIRTKTREQDYTKDLDFLNRDPLVQCPNCQTKLAAGQKFCPNCGTANPTAQVAQERFCTGCGAALKPGQKFCAECGTKN